MDKHANQKSQELAKTLWDIANDLRGNMDANKFKDYILGLIFYKYLSERTVSYTNEELLKDDGLTYEEALNNPDFAEVVKDWSIDYLGYIIEPQFLFSTFIANIKENKFSIQDLEKGIASLTNSTLGHPSEPAFDKLFDDMNLQDKDLGKEVPDRTALISKVMLKIDDNIDFDISESSFDILGTAYMILIGLFASDAGKKAGEFFTPTGPATVLSRLATVGLDEVRNVADPCAGSGSLLLDVQQCVDKEITHYYAQELNGSTYNLCRMNLLMHGVPHGRFSAYNDDTLKVDHFENLENGDFHVQVSNPPYSTRHGLDDSYLDDPRFSGAGVLPPKSYGDLLFLEHMVYHMADDGRVAILLPHGVLFRGNKELKIRKYLIDKLNCIDAVVGLPANLFTTTSIPVVALVLKAERNGDADNICFIDASKHFVKGKNQNEITDEDIDRIVDAYTNRKDIDKFCHIATLKEVKDNDYNLNIPRYVDTSEPEPEIILADVATRMENRRKEIESVSAELKTSFDQLGLKFPF